MLGGGISWIVLQLADSGFPVGGFVHSAGLEAAVQSGEVRGAESLEWFCTEAARQAAYGGLPFIHGIYEDPSRLDELDGICDALLSNHVANRASRNQGRAFLAACERSFELPAFVEMRERARTQKLRQHFAPLFGAAAHTLQLSLADTRQLFLFSNVRALMSAAVRLNVVGPYVSQQIQVRLVPALDSLLDQTEHLRAEDAAQTAPLLEICQMAHDRLYSRLFQS